ncbi:MAG: hypothetical protein ACHQAX_07875 [Gammaproteobacteria bacterium]
MMSHEEIVYLLDYDGSAGEIHVSDKEHQGFKTLHEANLKLNRRIAEDAAKAHVSRISIHCFSLRNSAIINAENSVENKNGCAFTEFERYANDLRTHHGEKIYLRKMLLQDLHQGKTPGWTWDAVTGKEQHPDLHKEVSIGDDTKLIITFAHIWHAYQDYKNDAQSPRPKLMFKICDDRDDILKVVSVFFKSNPDLLPPGCSLEFIEYWHTVDEVSGKERLYVDTHHPALTVSNNNTATHDKPFDIGYAVKQLEKLLDIDTYNAIIRVKTLPTGIRLEQLKEPTLCVQTLLLSHNKHVVNHEEQKNDQQVKP